MRVTNNMMTAQLMRNLSNNQETMYTQQDQLATGKRIQKASDDPILSSKILKYKSDINSLEQYDRNTSDALSWLEITESAVYDNVNLLQRARELAVQAANGTMTTEDTQKISKEIDGLTEQLISNGNTSYAGRYIFSGFETDKPLFQDDGTFNIDVTDYAMNNKPVTVYEISVGESIDISSNGLDLFGYEMMDDYFTQSTPIGVDEGIAATQSSLIGSFDLTQDYTGDNLDIILGGTTFNVDESVLKGDFISLTKEEVINELNNADDGGGNHLKDVADVYYNINNELVIKAKAFGNIAISEVSAIFNPTPTLGTNVVEAVVADTDIITDADVALNNTDYENKEMLITLNGETKKIKLFEPPTALPNNVNDVVTEMNSQFDLNFGAGNVVAVGVTGGSLSISTSNSTNSGVSPKLSVDIIKATESTLIKEFNDFFAALQAGDQSGIQDFLSKVDSQLNNTLSLQADIGARVNRLELITNRIAENSITYTRQLSNAQDADMAQVIMQLQNAENVYNASLSTGAKVIQPSLVDFLR